jgi:hypothetical protein
VYTATSRAVTRRLDQAGVPQTVDVERTIIERESPARWSAVRRAEARNVLTLGHAALPESPWLGDQEMAPIRACAADLAEFAGAGLLYWVPFAGSVGPLVEVGLGGPQFEADPAGWAARVVVLPALYHHLAALPSIDKADEASARAFADEVLMVATAPDLRYLVSVPLSGIYLDGADVMTAGDVCVRRLSPAEQGAIFDQRGGWLSLPVPFNFNELPYSVLELRVAGPRCEQHLRSQERIPSLITAFQLLGHHIVGRWVAERADPAWMFSGESYHPLMLPQEPRAASALTAEDFKTLITTAKRLEQYHISEPASAYDLALHRFGTASARNTYADRVLDFTIALEALLLPYDENARRGDLGYRFRVHGAHYLSERANERPETAKNLSRIYDMRSRLVHGARYPDRVQIRAVHDLAYDFARRGLLRAVREGFPTAEMFNQIVLS